VTRKKYLGIFAHPDDAEGYMGGTIIKLAQAGHEVKIISLTNGNAGHYSMAPDELATRRLKETVAAAEFAGADCEVWDIPDGRLEADLPTRERVIAAIREFSPDVVFTHRTFDYHPDHRAAAQLVQDASYMVIVPSVCPQQPVPASMPVILFTHDGFKTPCLFRPYVAVDIDAVMDAKIEMMACHESQFFEWLAHVRGLLETVPDDREERLAWLKENWKTKSAGQAEQFHDLLRKRYGAEAEKCAFAETFELSEYGRVPEDGELDVLLPR
jgi:LmbE family N-acetylglucosaminyl deacetylase